MSRQPADTDTGPDPLTEQRRVYSWLAAGGVLAAAAGALTGAWAATPFAALTTALALAAHRRAAARAGLTPDEKEHHRCP